ENQALTTDDPLKLSNNKEWWAESPWIDSWAGGNINSGASPVSFSPGYWDKSLSFYTKDVDGQRITALRGVSMTWTPTDQTAINAEVATPKTLWQEYGDLQSVPGSMRIKQFIGDLFYVGAVGNIHEGYVNGQQDAENYTEAADTGMILIKGLKLSAEVAASNSLYDETTPKYATKFSGNAYYASFEFSSNPENMLNKDYFNYQAEDPTENFFKSQIYFARMDDSFESSLSDYNGTSQDSYWGEHLTFYPSDYRYLPGVLPGLSQYDLGVFSIGNGMDYGRKVMAWRADTDLLENKLHGLGDFRYVTDNYGNNIESVTRTQWTYDATDKWTIKGLYWWNARPKTTSININGTILPVDPFVFTDNQTQDPVVNAASVPGKDPSLQSASLGSRYALTNWAAINGVWEYSNNATLGANEYPMGDLTSSFISVVPHNGAYYRETVAQIYDQGYFQQAPYEYHNIFKTGLELTPTQAWHIYLDYTANPNSFAGNIDDNMSHVGLETSYVLTPKMY
ncbi:MAG: hypothetical protein HQL13_06225, partial [Candidatus Omnitrophica bacterium]|nr:hypothetical protein [Candidatus Omnitrophota bacterium]